MIFWKNRWKKQLSQMVPKLREDVLNEPLPVTTKKEEVKPSFFKSPAFFRLACICSAFILVVTCSLWALSGRQGQPKDGFKTVMSIEVNPSMTFVCDDDGRIETVVSNNYDADVILSDGSFLQEVKNLKMEDGAKIFVDYCAKLGYFDLDGVGGAVKISTVEKDKAQNLLDKTKEKISGYFSQKGVFAIVVDEIISSEEFLKKSGIEEQTTKDVTEVLKEKNPVYSNREASQKTQEEIEEIYGKEFADSSVKDYLAEKIEQNIQKLCKNYQNLIEIEELNIQIFMHKDNPFIWLRDYWSILALIHEELPSEALSKEFKDLLRDIEKSLEQYQRDYGVKIDSYERFKELLNPYQSLGLQKGDDLKEVLKGFTKEKYKELKESFVKILTNIGVDVSDIDQAEKIPSTKEEYNQMVEELNKHQFEDKKENNKDSYDKPREEIKDGDYNSFVEQIIEQYGSLKEYWDSLQKEKDTRF